MAFYIKYFKLYLLIPFITLCSLALGVSGQTISTIAGINTNAGYTGDGGSALTAAIGTPAGITIDPTTGNICFSDSYNNVVRMIDASGIITTLAGNGTSGYSGDGFAATSAQLHAPAGITFDNSGNLYIADNGNFVVRMVDITGVITTFAGNGVAATSGDYGMATDASLAGATGVYFNANNGNILIADGVNTVRFVKSGGVILPLAGGTSGYSGDAGPATDAALNAPTAVTADLAGNIYITDKGNNAIRKVSSSGVIKSILGTPPSGASGYSGDGGPASLATANSPCGISIDTSGNIYFADQGNNVIRKINAYGVNIFTIAGTSSPAYSGDGGPATSATLSGVSDVVVNSHGDIYIADQNNNVIRKVTHAALLTIATASDTVCSGVPVTFTATLLGAIAAPHYSWQVNGAYIGTDSTIFTADSIHTGDVIICALVDSSGDTLDISAPLSMTTIPTVTPSVTMTPSSTGAICLGSTVTFTPVPVNGGLSPDYEWTLDGSIVSTSATYSVIATTGSNIISCKMHSSLQCLSTPYALSIPDTLTLSPISPVSVAITASHFDTVCAGTTVVFEAVPVNGGSSPVFHWSASGTAIGTDSNIIHYTPLTGDAVRCEMISNISCPSADSVSSNTLSYVVNPVVVPSVSIIVSGGDSACTGLTKTITATPVNGGPSPIFHWLINGVVAATGNPLTYTPASGDMVTCVLFSSICVTADSLMSDSVRIIVFPYATPLISINCTDSSVCAGTSVTFYANAIDTGHTPSYSWRKNGTPVATTASYSFTPAAGDVIYCKLTSSIICPSPDTAISNTISMDVVPSVTPSVSISAAGGDTTCPATTVNFTATSINGGTTPIYIWYRNGVGVGVGSVYSSTVVTGDVINCKLVSSAPCVTADTVVSSSITMFVRPALVPSVSIIAAPGDTVCAGTTVVFSQTSVNPGISPSYTWRVNGVNTGSSSTFSYTPANGDIVVCKLLSNALCVSPDSVLSPSVTLVVNPVLTPTIHIASASGTSVCAGTSVTYSATTSYSGPAPTYNWRVNGIAAGAGATYTYIPASGDIITCKLTSNAPCVMPDTAISNAIVMSVSPIVVPSITISVTPGDSVCAATATSFNSVTYNGGTAPFYRWYVNGTSAGFGTTYSYTPLSGDVIRCELTSNALCRSTDSVSSNIITMTVVPDVAPTITISTSTDTICAGSSALFTSAVTYGGSSPLFSWMVNGVPTGAGPTFSYPVSNGDIITCRVTGNYSCASVDTATSNSITMSVLTVLVPSVTISGTPGAFILVGQSDTCTAIVTNGGSAPDYQWQINGIPVSGATNATYIFTSLNEGDNITCVITSSAPCVTSATATSNSIPITITNLGVAQVAGPSLPLSVIPNPNSGTCLLTGSLADRINGNAIVTIFDIYGKTIYQKEIVISDSKIHADIVIDNNIPDGLYFINLKSLENSQTIQFILNR